jgi:AcrR family transcriptional regulator
MAKPNGSVRTDQRLRTRKDLLEAARRLLQEKQQVTFEDVAREAMVSRATAYRYFPSVEALLIEAPLDGAVAEPASFFAGDASTDPIERLDRAEAALHDMTYRNEAQLRAMLAHALEQSLGDAKDRPPVRQNRRLPLIEAALAPARDRLDDATYARLCAALALIFGTESMLVFRDVTPLDPAEARRVKSWAIEALVRRAIEDSKGAAPRKGARRANGGASRPAAGAKRRPAAARGRRATTG